MDDLVRRPELPGGWRDRLAAWLEWFGVARLISSAVAVLVVCVGAWWLVRAPVPPTEASLPRVPSTAVSTTSAPAPVVSDPAPDDVDGAGAIVTQLVVHVAGAVARPGIYRFEPGDRIADAIERAGGATRSGRPHELNLAAPLTDGMRVDVPVEGEAPSAALVADAPTEVGRSGSDVGGPVDVNTATAAQLDELPGVGPATAAAIVTERDRNGPFVAVDDLERVPGIGPAKLAALRNLVTT